MQVGAGGRRCEERSSVAILAQFGVVPRVPQSMPPRSVAARGMMTLMGFVRQHQAEEAPMEAQLDAREAEENTPQQIADEEAPKHVMMYDGLTKQEHAELIAAEAEFWNGECSVPNGLDDCGWPDFPELSGLWRCGAAKARRLTPDAGSPAAMQLVPYVDCAVDGEVLTPGAMGLGVLLNTESDEGSSSDECDKGSSSDECDKGSSSDEGDKCSNSGDVSMGECDDVEKAAAMAEAAATTDNADTARLHHTMGKAILDSFCAEFAEHANKDCV